MKRTAALLILVLAPPWMAPVLHAQTGEGGLVGFVKDAQGAVLPGVSVTATSPALIGARTSVSDSAGYYRLVNLPPGGYTVSAELQGFSSFRREGVIVRAGSTFAVDIVLQIGSLQEIITVTAETPMLEVGRPIRAINIQGEFQRAVPLQSRRNWSDFLELTPGVHMRLSDEGSGRPVYHGLAAELFAHVIQFEGAIAGGYNDFQLRNVNLGSEAIGDVHVKAGGADAASPMGTGVVINVVAPSGGDTLRGSVGYAYQPLAWNDNNLSGPSSPNATPTVQQVNQLDLTMGGPIVRQRAWFFGAFRYDNLENSIARQQINVDRIRAFRPNSTFFNNDSVGYQPFAKVTARLRDGHEVSAFYQYDRTKPASNLETFADPINRDKQGGSLVSAKVTSAWSNRLTSVFQVAWNNKGSGSGLELEDFSGPQLVFHQSALPQGGRLNGTGTLVVAGNSQNRTQAPGQILMVRGDLTYFRDGWWGGHELQAGFLAGRFRIDGFVNYVNDGFILEEHRQIDPANMAAGTIPFRRQFADQLSLQFASARDRDVGLYLQDSWTPHARFRVSLGLRVDFVRRHDEIFDIDRMKDTAVGPRFGLSYLVTNDARNVLRFSAARVHEQVTARDNVTSFGGTSRVGFTDLYDQNGDGVFETRFVTPPVTARLAGFEFDPELHQPWVDEFIVGFMKQFPGRLAVDVSAMRRYYEDVYGLVDVNGIYPDGPGRPFVGFGRVDPARGLLFQQTNNTWNTTVYTSLDITVSKDLSQRLRILGGYHHQWQHLDGTWNPTDPGRFIQPDAFPISRGIPPTRGNRDQNTLATTTGVSQWPPYRLGIAGTYNAPWNVVFGASLNVQAGEYSAPIQTRLPAADPVFGPPTVPVQGGVQSNPLATPVRFAFRTRADDQERVPAVRFLNVKVGRTFPVGKTKIEAAINVFNVFNEGRFYQFNTGGGANQQFSPNFLQPRNLQAARAAQLTVVAKF